MGFKKLLQLKIILIWDRNHNRNFWTKSQVGMLKTVEQPQISNQRGISQAKMNCEGRCSVILDVSPHFILYTSRTYTSPAQIFLLIKQRTTPKPTNKQGKKEKKRQNRIKRGFQIKNNLLTGFRFRDLAVI